MNAPQTKIDAVSTIRSAVRYSSNKAILDLYLEGLLAKFSTLIPGFISFHLTVAAILEWVRAHQLRFTSNEYLAMQATQANEHVLERKQIGKYESKKAQYQKEQLFPPCSPNK